MIRLSSSSNVLTLAALAGLLTLLGLTLVLASGARPLKAVEPLASSAGWEVVEGFHPSPGPNHRLDAPEEIRSFSGLLAWRTYTPQLGMTIGRIVSAPFVAPDYLAIPYVGFPGERPGNRVAIQCETTGAEIEVATRRTNTQWAVAFLRLQGFCPGPIRLIAENTSEQTYIGVATPFIADAGVWFANTQPGLRILAAIGTWLIFSLLGLASATMLRRAAPALHPIPAALIGVGVLGMVLLVCFTVDPFLGRTSVWAVCAVAALSLLKEATRDMHAARSALYQARGPLLAWLGVSLSYVAAVAMADSGGGAWAINGLFTPVRWSSDNQLPIFFADALLSSQSRSEIGTGGPWLVTDRGPLLAALLTIPGVLLALLSQRWGSQMDVHTYFSAAIVIQSSWVLLIPLLAARIGLRRPGCMLLALAAMPFMFFNSIYAWPKLLGATYVVVCCVLLFCSGARDLIRQKGVLPLIAVAAALAYLAHASHVFALVPLALIAARTIFAAGPVAIAAGAVAAGLVAAPWFWWQLAIQPQATALTRFALAGQFGFDRRADPIWPEVIAYYRALGWSGWLTQKTESARLILGLPHNWMAFAEVARDAPNQPPLGAFRVADFFSLARALGVLLLALPLTLLARLDRHRMNDAGFAFVCLGVGALGIIFPLLAIVPPAWVHALPYGAILLLAIGLLLLADRLPTTFAWPLPVLAVAYSLLVWIVPAFLGADRLMWSSAVGIAAGVALAAAGILPSSYHWVERPSLRFSQNWLGERFGRPRLFRFVAERWPSHFRVGAEMAPFTPKWLLALCWGTAGLALLQAVYILIAWLNTPLLDQHAFRQTQTALSALWLQRGGQFFAYETPVVGSPWSIPFEMPIYQFVVAGVATLGVPLDAAGRLVSFSFLLAAAWPLRMLWRDFALPPIGLPMAFALILASPQYAFWSRTFLVESCAWFLALLWLALLGRYLRDGRIPHAIAAAAVGLLAVCAKATTFPAFALLGGFLALPRFWTWLRVGRDMRGGLSLLVIGAVLTLPFAGGYAWTMFADGVKIQNQIGQMLMSANLVSWNFGNLRQKFGAELWSGILPKRILPDALGGAFFIGLLVLAGSIYKKRDIFAIVLCVIAFLTPLLIFTNLHVVHNYYQYANSAFLLVAIAVGLGSLATSGRLPMVAAVCLVTLLISQAFHFQRHQLAWLQQSGEGFGPHQIAVAAREALPATGSLIVLGDDWSSTVPYYSGLKVLALPRWTPPAILQRALSDPQASLEGTQFAGVVYCRSSTEDYGPAGQPLIEAFVAGRPVLAERGNCRLLASTR